MKTPAPSAFVQAGLAGCAFLPAAAALAGCAALSRAEPEVAHIQLVRSSSPIVTVESLGIRREEVGVFLDGNVSKNPRVDSTAGTHLDVVYYGRNGVPLAEETARFTPGEIPARFRGVGGRVRYRMRVNHPLAAIGRIEVRAHEGAHPKL